MQKQEQINRRFVELVAEKSPRHSGCKPDDLVSCLPKHVIVSIVVSLNEAYDLKVDAHKFAAIAEAVAFKEVGQTLMEYPHLRKEQVLSLFGKALIRKNVRISSGCITRPHLITLVEALEDYTGLKVTDETSAPLAYLDEQDETLTVEDVADFFSNVVGKIAKIVTAKRLSRQRIKNYLAFCCSVADVDENSPITSLSAESIGGEYYTVVNWMEERFDKMVPNEFVETKTIKDLLDFFAA